MWIHQADCPEIHKTFVGSLPESFTVVDHLFGFDQALQNTVLQSFTQLAKQRSTRITIKCSYFIDEDLQQCYPELDLQFAPDSCPRIHHLRQYKIHPELDYKNFLCSFNGSGTNNNNHAHVSRKLLVSALKKFDFFDPEFCSKNFVFTKHDLDGNLQLLTKQRFDFYSKFFLLDDDQNFYGQLFPIGQTSYNHMTNIPLLENILTQSFVHVVSETLATSFYPLISEKCFYSIVTRGLFVTFGQPGWHEHLEKYYGFRLYNKLFDYRFDTIKNPVERLIELLSMISKFQKLSAADWQDLYELEKENIEYNYDHYFSGKYMKNLYE